MKGKLFYVSVLVFAFHCHRRNLCLKRHGSFPSHLIAIIWLVWLWFVWLRFPPREFSKLPGLSSLV